VLYSGVGAKKERKEPLAHKIQKGGKGRWGKLGMRKKWGSLAAL
jgi:hypothetical protein